MDILVEYLTHYLYVFMYVPLYYIHSCLYENNIFSWKQTTIMIKWSWTLSVDLFPRMYVHQSTIFVRQFTNNMKNCRFQNCGFSLFHRQLFKIFVGAIYSIHWISLVRLVLEWKLEWIVKTEYYIRLIIAEYASKRIGKMFISYVYALKLCRVILNIKTFIGK